MKMKEGKYSMPFGLGMLKQDVSSVKGHSPMEDRMYNKKAKIRDD